MNIIVAVDKNWAIGCNNKLLVSIPGDMKFFRDETTDKVVVVGRKTLKTFPNGLPLKNRLNVIMTSDKDFRIRDALVVHCMEELLEKLKEYRSEDIYVVGGESIYRQMLPYCDVAYVTRIDQNFQADTYFPNLDDMPEWRKTEESEEQTYFDLEYAFTKYERTK